MDQEYQEIDLLELIHVVLQKWWIIAGFVVTAAICSAYITINMVTPMYEAKSTLFIGKESDSFAGISFSDLQIDDQLVVDYKELIKTRLVTLDVIKELNLNMKVSDFIEGLTIETIADSRFVHISFTGDDPAMATEITNSLSRHLIAHAVDIVGVKNVTVVDEAIVPEQPISPSLMKNVAIAVVLGGMFALGVIFVLHLMDNTFKKEEDIEKQLGMGVLGIIPVFEGEERGM